MICSISIANFKEIGGRMYKQLSLFDQDEWWMKIFHSIPEEKKAEIVEALKKLFIAEVEKTIIKGEYHGE